MKRIASCIIVVSLFLSLFAFTLNIQPAKAILLPLPHIYIKSDGSVWPETVPIHSTDNVTYSFAGNILNYSLIIQRSDIILDGNQCTIERYPVTGAFDVGVLLESQNNVTIKNVTVKGFNVGVRLSLGTTNTKIVNCTIADSVIYAMEIAQSSHTLVGSNNLTNNGHGISISYSVDTVMTGNMIQAQENQQALELWGLTMVEYINQIDTTNTVNGKPVYYLMNQHNQTITPSTYPEIGWLALINCTGMTVENQTLSRNAQGLLLAFTSHTTIKGNNVTENGFGIWMGYSSHNTIIDNYFVNIGDGIALLRSSGNNTIRGNMFEANWDGIEISENSNGNLIIENVFKWNLNGMGITNVANNRIYHNNFIDNGQQGISDSTSVNAWDNGVEGNYWSNYAGVDVNPHDGIGDSPYIIDGNNQDNYPLMAPYIPGDYNHDGIVDLTDVDLVRNAWQSKIGDLNYNSHVDFDMKGIINIIDASIIGLNWQKHV